MSRKIVSPSVTRRLLRDYRLTPRRHWGQNFLIDENILQKIVQAAELEGGDRVLEIGAGIGTLTQAVAEAGSDVVAVEIDPGLARLFRDNFSEYSRVCLVEGDVRKLDLGGICLQKWGDARVKVVANLPYYLTTPIMFQLLEKDPPLSMAVLMVQKELAQRMTASPGTKSYGLLTVLCRLYGEPEMLFGVSRNVFFPRPAVDSAVVRLRVKEFSEAGDCLEEWFWPLVRAVFQNRRKTLAKVLVHLGAARSEAEHILQEAGIHPQQRGETLSVKEFAKLGCLIYNKTSK